MNNDEDITNINDIKVGTDLKDIKEVITIDINNPNILDIITTTISLIDLYYTDDNYSKT